MICVAEKGNLCVELTVEAGEAGHSSAPPKEGAISILADALVRLHRAPFPAHADSLQLLFGALRGGFKWPMQMIVSNLWLFMPLLRAVLASKPKTATLVRTTTALTVIRAGSRSNVLPVSASAVANFRIHPADSVTSILARLKTVIRDERAKLRTLLATEPLPRLVARPPGLCRPRRLCARHLPLCSRRPRPLRRRLRLQALLESGAADLPLQSGDTSQGRDVHVPRAQREDLSPQPRPVRRLLPRLSPQAERALRAEARGGMRSSERMIRWVRVQWLRLRSTFVILK